MTDSTNPIVTKVEDYFQLLIWNPLTEAAIDSLFVALPGFAVWPVGPLIRWFVPYLSDRMYSIICLTVDMEAVVISDEDHQKAYAKAVVTLQSIASTQGVNSDAYKNARINAEKALAAFVHYGP